MTRIRIAVICLPLALALTACGGSTDTGSSSSSSPSAPSPSAPSPSAPSPSAPSPSDDLADLSPECQQAIVSFETYYLDLAGIAMSMVGSGEIDATAKEGLTAAADQLDRSADGLDGVFPDAPAAYADLVAIIRGQATTLRTWPQSHDTTDGLAQALDTFTDGSAGQEAFVGVIDDLQERCAPFEWSN